LQNSSGFASIRKGIEMKIMRNYILQLCILVLISLSPLTGICQIDNTIKIAYSAKSLFPGLPTLDTLINASISNSGAYGYYLDEVEIKKLELKKSRNNWSDYIYINGNVGYGYYDQVFRDNSIPDLSLNTIIAGQQFTYFAGLSMKIPFSSIFKNNQTRKIHEFEIDKAVNEVDKVKFQVAEIVNEKYFELIEAYQIFLSKTNEYEAVEIDIQKSEKEFLEGKIGVSAMTEVRKSYLKVQLEKDRANADLIKKLTQLEMFTGLNFNTNFYLSWN